MSCVSHHKISHPLSLETLLMRPHDPARRRLLGGLLAGLFGWLVPAKAQAIPPQPLIPPEPAGGTLVNNPCTYS